MGHLIKTITLPLLCLSLSLPLAYANGNEDRTKQDLDQIQKELKSSAERLKKQRSEITSQEKNLKQAELEIAHNAKSLKELNFATELNRNEQLALEDNIKELNTIKLMQQNALAAQLRSAYMSGSHDYSKLLLNQQEVTSFERTLSYYSYLNNARIKQIDSLKTTLIELAANQDKLAATQSQLVVLLAEQKQKQNALVLAQNERKTSLQQLKKQLSSTQSAIDYLKQNEQMLRDTLQELQQQVQEIIRFDGLLADKGKLNWPSRGRLTHKFGQRKHGSFRWKGVVIKANEGAPVTTIHHGQVVFSDWLKGFGWVVVIDHGEGFMSLYGHNQAILKEVGDQVTQGEVIALVGQSGGQSDPGLYFEIRHKGSAVNPNKWCR